MKRVAETPQMRPVPSLPPVRAELPWWVRAASHPAAVLSFAIIALLLWEGEQLFGGTTMAAQWVSAQVSAAADLLGTLNPEDSPAIWSGIFLGLSPLLAVVYFALYRGSMGLFLALSGISRAPSRA
jgi:hypothetical protein